MSTRLCEPCVQCDMCVSCGLCTCNPYGRSISGRRERMEEARGAKKRGDHVRAAVCVVLAKQYHAITKTLGGPPDFPARRKRPRRSTTR